MKQIYPYLRPLNKILVLYSDYLIEFILITDFGVRNPE